MERVKTKLSVERLLLANLEPEGILITKDGLPIALVTPATSNCADLIGSMKGKIKIHGNIFSTGAKWDSDPMTR